jgi:hypothetical protein
MLREPAGGGATRNKRFSAAGADSMRLKPVELAWEGTGRTMPSAAPDVVEALGGEVMSGGKGMRPVARGTSTDKMGGNSGGGIMGSSVNIGDAVLRELVAGSGERR